MLHNLAIYIYICIGCANRKKERYELLKPTRVTLSGKTFCAAILKETTYVP